jgi:uncharacterized protein
MQQRANVLSQRRFTFYADAGFETSIGGFVLMERDGRQLLGQVTGSKTEYSIVSSGHSASGTATAATIECEGTLVARVQIDRVSLSFDMEPTVGGATNLSKAPSGVVHSYFDAVYEANVRRVAFPVGKLLSTQGVEVRLFATGFSRPTGLFGQSGSGKSFALGSIIEGLMHNTLLDIVILDPNGDFVHVCEPLRPRDQISSGGKPLTDDEYEHVRHQHEEVCTATKVLSSEPDSRSARLGIMPLDLEPRDLVKLINLDAVSNVSMFQTLKTVYDDTKSFTDKTYRGFRTRCNSITPDGIRLGTAMDAAGLESYKIWLGDNRTEGLAQWVTNDKLRVLIIDLSPLSRVERGIVTTVVCRLLWERQRRRKLNAVRRATILVVDEAHTLFSSHPTTLCDQTTLDWGVTIAGEGRKFGLFLLLASQLPSKIHEHVVTQCGNLVLMRMLSEGEVTTLQSRLSFASESFLQLSRRFETGDALVMGSIAPAPLLMHFDRRLTQEGGGDMIVQWRPEEPTA